MPLFSPLAPTTFVVETNTTLPTFPTTNNSKKNATTRAAALAILHNHAAMIELNPLVESYALCDPDDDDIAAPPAPTARKGGHGDDAEEEEEASATYRITDTLPLLPGGLWSSRTTYAARFVDRADGLETAVRAALGVESRSVWVVVASSSAAAAEGPEESKLLLRETATVTCPWAVRAFVEGTIRKAHKELGHAFVERLERGEAAEPVGKKEKKKTGAK
ncbi:uncharacterized protein IWZ02DRAFT_433091 [Phyllosticta citriasiana]|uniref:DUF7053 domain-containing protein n=1 Tax=Phyllosticta citriasiana TaxID=595635 RepID=A0ABR1KSR6_9PEZI